MEIRHLVSLALQPRTSVLLAIISNVGALSPKQPPRLVGDASGRFSVYTTKDICSISDRISQRLGGRLHLYLALSTCDPIAEDAF